jgi:hypothetical protein
MSLDLNPDILGIPSPSETSLKIFSELIVDTIDAVNKRLKVTHHRVPDEPFDIILLSFLLLPVNEWKSKFTNLRKVAFRFFTTPDIFWATIALGLYSPKVGDAYKKFNPLFDPEKYLIKTSTIPAPQKITPQATPTPKKKAKVLDRKTSPYQHETCEKFLGRKYPRWPFARLYRLTKSNNYHDSGVRGYWVLKLSQIEHSRKGEISLRTDNQFFHVCKRHGICMKVIKEDPEEKLCAIWVFAKTMRQAQRLLRKWRSERPRLRKLLLGLR